MHELMRRCATRVDYKVGVTNAHTTRRRRLKEGQGVCQDHAHIFISAARVLGMSGALR